jgi:uncharacterized protein YceH (UPF0502 family)
LQRVLVNELAAEEVRVLGCLVEKQLTTPQQYPLTLNALTLACNQSSNRDPVVSYDEKRVEQAVVSAKTKGLARFVHPSHGRSAIRYAHTLEEALGVDRRQLALLSALMLRGPQTPGELRTRTARAGEFESLDDLERELERLVDRDEPLIARLSRRPGQKEVRFAHLLCAGTDSEEPLGDEPPSSPGRAGTYEAAQVPDRTIGTEVHRVAEPNRAESEPHWHEDLQDQVAGLRHEVDILRRDLDDLRAQLGD